ncbi:dihydroorotase [Fontimonas sp. SYSU GA230001]|uniref:dihydroorotase n=1 Tax=Fontimonas sp. SYSU GA230001 TaxID=3142450 RepID=UPI0032B3A4F0
MNRPTRMREWSAQARRDRPAGCEGALLISGARVLDPASGLDAVTPVLLQNGVVAAIGAQAARQPAQCSIEADGCWLTPGLVDLCARFREPGQTHKASFASEARAALASGITHVLIPPDTQPVIDTPAMMLRLQRIADQSGAGLGVHGLGALTRDLAGEALAELSALKAAGAVGASNGLAPVRDSRIARRALEYAKGLDLPVHVFAQDPALASGGCAHEGPVATRLGLAPVPVAAEVAALRYWISLVEDTGARVHFCRLSTARGAELVASAQQRRLPVSADVAAHQLHLTDVDVDGFDARCHVVPPLRSREDRDALRAAVRDGVVQAICSDHQPHEADAKINPFPLTEPGISGLETLLPLTLALVHEDRLAPLDAVARLTTGPAAIAGIAAGRIALGEPADLALIDPRCEWTLRTETLLSAGRNTPFAGRTMRGRVLRCFSRGVEAFAATAPA